MAQSVMCNTKKEPLDGKDFCINVSRHHTFGTDAVLLADFADARKNDKAVDLGTGCGIIGFLMLRDNKTKELYGVDISSEAIALCEKTVEELSLAERFVPVCSDLKDLKGKVPFGSATLVTCNPPYKASGTGIKNPDSIDAVARHEVACNLSDIVGVAHKLLNTSGRLCMCLRPERLAELLSLMSANGIEPKRLRFVAQKQGKEPWLFLVEGKKGAKTGLRIAPTLYIEDENGFSEEMLGIYGPYKESFI